MTLQDMRYFCNFTVSHFTGGSDGKESACSAGAPGVILGLGRSLGWEDPLEKEMATQIHYSYLESSMDRGS